MSKSISMKTKLSTMTSSLMILGLTHISTLSAQIKKESIKSNLKDAIHFVSEDSLNKDVIQKAEKLKYLERFQNMTPMSIEDKERLKSLKERKKYVELVESQGLQQHDLYREKYNSSILSVNEERILKELLRQESMRQDFGKRVETLRTEIAKIQTQELYKNLLSQQDERYIQFQKLEIDTSLIHGRLRRDNYVVHYNDVLNEYTGRTLYVDKIFDQSSDREIVVTTEKSPLEFSAYYADQKGHKITEILKQVPILKCSYNGKSEKLNMPLQDFVKEYSTGLGFGSFDPIQSIRVSVKMFYNIEENQFETKYRLRLDQENNRALSVSFYPADFVSEKEFIEKIRNSQKTLQNCAQESKNSQIKSSLKTNQNSKAQKL